VIFRRLLALALVVVPSIAGAQFTTFIPPVDKVADSAKVIAAAEKKVERERTVREQLTNMKTWVDSAAGVPIAPSSDSAKRPSGQRVDTTEHADAATSTAAQRRAERRPERRPEPPPPLPRDTTPFPEGAQAPATASALPFLLLGGLGLFFAGLILVTAPRRRMRVNVRDRRQNPRA